MTMRAHWTVPRMWLGRQVAIFASGASMNRGIVNTVAALQMKTIAVNRTYELAPAADILYAADAGFWNYYRPVFAGLKVCIFADGDRARRSQLPPDDVLMLKKSGVEGFDDDPSSLRTGNNSGYQAIHLAAHTGARDVFLFGFDMKGGHWHPRYPIPLRNTKPEQYVVWSRMFGGLAAALGKRGVSVWNCNPDSALTAFPFLDFAATFSLAA